jgi:alkylation response protein AidB-like acyl-CoA dehydrogenase
VDFTLTQEQGALADSVRRFCERDYGADRRQFLIETGMAFSPENWRAIADLGWIGAGLGEADGGFGGSAIETALVMQEFGRALVVDPFLGVAVLALQTLAALPPEEKRDALIASLVAGDTLLALAHAEPASRGDVDHCAAAARQIGTDWTISGDKTLIPGGAAASSFLVSAQTPEGIGLFQVDGAAPGVSATCYRTIDNHHVADLRLIEASARLIAGPPLAAQAIAAGYAHAQIALCAEAIGSMDAVLALTVEYIRTRRQFGAALGSFQVVQHRVADMLVELELARSTLYYGLAHIAESGVSRDHAVSTLKAITSSSALFVGRNAIQLHGAIGVTEACIVSHHYRRLTVIAALFGNEAVHLKRLAALEKPIWE